MCVRNNYKRKHRTGNIITRMYYQVYMYNYTGIPYISTALFYTAIECRNYESHTRTHQSCPGSLRVSQEAHPAYSSGEPPAAFAASRADQCHQCLAATQEAAGEAVQ